MKLTTLTLLGSLLSPSLDDFDGLRSALVALGDVNGDGLPDLALAHRPRPFAMMGSSSENWPSVPQEPVVWILSGEDGAVQHALQGPEGFGTELAAVGDLDGDGASELAIGAGREGAAEGGVLLVSTGPGRILARLEAPEGLSCFGRGIAGGQQLTGSETPDLVIGALGGALVIDGATRAASWWLEPRAGCRIERRPVDEGSPFTEPLAERPAWGVKNLGRSCGGSYPGMNVGVLPDLDGDGLGEVALSTPREPACEETGGEGSEAAQADARTRIVFSGGLRSPLSLDTAGWCLVAGEDLDGDGVGDLVTTTVNEHTRAWSGATGARLWEVSYRGGYLHAEGASLSFTSDHDGDEVRDLAVGSNETFLDADSGGIAILSGRTGESLKRRRVRIEADPGPPAGGVGGADVASLGDLDGDGLDELAIWEPVPQRLLILSGADLSVRWQLDAADLPRPE